MRSDPVPKTDSGKDDGWAAVWFSEPGTAGAKCDSAFRSGSGAEPDLHFLVGKLRNRNYRRGGLFDL